MSKCKLQIRAINKLQSDNVISPTREIKDIKAFEKLNQDYTEAAVSDYGLETNGQLLFDIDTREIKLPTGNAFYRDNIRTIFKAVPNESLFKEFQNLYDNTEKLEQEADGINYSLKAIDILQSKKAEQLFEKGRKNGWDLNKILTELQVPKQQKQIILDKSINGREEIITSLLADNSFVVEVNTTKTNIPKGYRSEEEALYEEYTDDDFFLNDETGEIEHHAQTKPDWNNITEENSKYYSSLTVPGGINYTENEIATPDITPNIKGHAQFSTDNGIGWFRSDEKLNNSKLVTIPQDKQGDFNEPNLPEDEITTSIGELTKTRRILEVQSDLFQKGRDKSNLVSTGLYQMGVGNATQQQILDGERFNLEEQGYSEEEVNIKVKELEKTLNKEKNVDISNNDNQFLQLLNKKNNWVTFFIQSIIQDSDKKGYEKVLFPLGDTAAKIEGHQTLEEFKKQKEARIKELEKRTEKYNKEIEDWNKSKKNISLDKNLPKEILKEDLSRIEDIILDIQLSMDDDFQEIKNLKQELTNVESGQTQLSSIASFYENTVTNILKKNYEVKEVMDEHGNKWNEVNLITEKLKNNNFEILLKEKDLKKQDSPGHKYLYNNPSSKAVDSTGESLTMDEVTENFNNIRDRIFGGEIKNTTVNQILRTSLQKMDLNEETKGMLRTMLTSRTKIKFVDKFTATDTVGEYETSKDEIRLNFDVLMFHNAEAAFELILHEIIHAYSYKALKGPKNDVQREFRNNMEELYSQYKTSVYSMQELYGFSSVDEFVSEIISNPVFRNHIDSISEAEGSMLSRIIRYIKSLLGLSNEKKSTQIVDTIMEFVKDKENNGVYKSPLGKNYEAVLEKKTDNPKYSEKFTKEIYSLDKITKKIISDIDSVTARSAAVRGKNDENTKRFKEVKKLIEQFADVSANKAIYQFVEFANNELSSLNNSLTNKIRSGNIDSDYLFRANSYTAIYSSLGDIKDVLQNQYDNKLIEKDEYNKLINEIDSAKSNYDSFYTSYLNQSKEILTDRLAPYNTKPYTERRIELEREYNRTKPSESKDKWINDKLDLESERLSQLQYERTREMMDEIPMDLQSLESMVTSEKNLPDLLLKLYSQMLDNVELKIRNQMLGHRNSFMATLKEFGPQGSTNEDRYKELISQDSEGNYYMIGEYLPEFHRKYKELASKKAIAYEEFGKQSEEFKTATGELKKWLKTNTKLDPISKVSKVPADKWKNKKFTKLSEKNKKYHKFLIDKIREADKNTLGHKSLIINSHNVEFIKLPSIRRSDLDRLMGGDVKGVIKDSVGDFSKIRVDDTNFGEQTETDQFDDSNFVKALTTVNGEERNLVPIHFRNNITPEDQSLDLPTILLMNSVMAEEFKGKHAIEAESALLLDIVGNADVYKTQSVSRKLLASVFSREMKSPDLVHIKGKDSKIYDKLKNVIENRVYNILDVSNNKTGSDNVTVIAKSIMGYTAHLTLAVNYLSAVPNMVQGKLQNFIESVGGTTYSRKDIRWAESTYWKEMGREGFGDIGKAINHSKLNLVVDYLNIMTDFNMVKHDFEKDNKFKALFNSHSLHAFNNMAEHYAQSTLMLSVLSSVKAMDGKGNLIDNNGNIVKDKSKAMNMYEAMEIKDGQVVFHPKVKRSSFSPTSDLEGVGLVQLQNLVRKKIIDLHGQYDNKWQATFQRSWHGKAMSMFRRWLIPGFYRRWRGMYYANKDFDELNTNQKYYSLETQQFEEGTYTSLVRYFWKGVIPGLKEMKLEIMSSKWEELTDYEKSNIHKTLREILVTSLMFVGAMITAAAADEDEDNADLLFTLAYIFRRQESELMQYYSPSDTLRIFRSPFASLNTIEKTMGLFNQLMPWNIGEEYKTGERKGEYKAWVKTKKLVPVISQSERSAEQSFKFLENLLSY